MSLSELLLCSTPLTRRDAAKIIHEYLLNVIKEPDEQSISGAAVLKDLYDCNVCVNHIAQVYLKGIMEPVSDDLFGGTKVFNLDDVHIIEQRVFNKALRNRPQVYEGHAAFTRFNEIENIINPVICDVRTKHEYEKGHVKGSINIPLNDFMINPHLLSYDKYKNVIFICNASKSAEIAALFALENGYKNVFYTGYEL